MSFLFDLASHLSTPVHKILDHMPEDELTYWWARQQIQPMRERADESRTANALLFIYQFFSSKKAKMLSLDDFLPQWMTRK